MTRDARQLAEQLRDHPPVLDDVARARMEKALLASTERGVSASSGGPRTRRPFVAGVGAGLAVAALALLAWLGLRAPSEHTVAYVETFTAEGADVRAEELAEGGVVLTAPDERIRAHFAERRVEVEVRPSSRARFLRVAGADMALGLDRGSVRVSFHPERRGERSLAVETPLARVEVVGTIFEVTVDAEGTHVRVEEGIVRVVPREGAERFVHAGESHRVLRPELARASEADERERVVEGPTFDAPEGSVEAAPESGDVWEEPASSAQLGGHAAARSTARAPTWESGEAAIDEPSPAEGLAPEEETPDPSESRATRARAREGRPLADDLRFELAMRHVDAGRFDEARHQLHAIVRTSASRAQRARAWTDIALTHAREGDVRQATEAYRRAAEVGRGTEAGANALFALGQMRLRLGEDELARAAFREYVDAAPEGPLADRARRTLCQRLGVWEECGE